MSELQTVHTNRSIPKTNITVHRQVINTNQPYKPISSGDVNVQLKFRRLSEHVSLCVVNTKGILIACFKSLRLRNGVWHCFHSALGSVIPLRTKLMIITTKEIIWKPSIYRIVVVGNGASREICDNFP